MTKFVKKFCAAFCAAACMVSAFPISSLAASQTKYEAENAVLSNLTPSYGADYSGGKYVSIADSGSVSFKISVSESGLYDFNFVSKGIGGDKLNSAALDGTKIGQFSSSGDALGDAAVSAVYVEKGSHTVKVTPDWGWINLDCLIVTKTQQKDYYNGVSKTLINSKASLSAQRLMSYIADNYGTNVISGQTCDGGLNGSEFKAIKNLTGKTPAILGMDLMRYTPTRVSKGDSCKTVENAIEFSEAGGIVELCWHWNAPDKYLKSGTDSSGNPRWWGGFYTENLDMDFSAIMDGTDKEGYDLLMADIDAIAVQLKKLSDADVPVLFRPLHEASGGWFWWGSDGSAPYKKLWKVMYDKLTNEYGLNNLIWVWNGQDKSWYPGDDYVDIIGEDIYPGKRVYDAQSGTFDEAANYTSSNKVVALTENGCLFDVDKALNSGTVWSWFCTWSGEFCSNSTTTISETYTEKSMWKKVYNHENVITLDELPNLKTYPLKAAVSKCNISLSASSYTYSGTAKKPTVTVKYGAKTLKKGTDYTVSYSNNVNAGTAKVTIKGIGDYTGTTVKTFKISAKSISSASVTGVKSAYVYTGKKISPAVTVKLGGTALKKGTAYTVSYSANTSAGKAKVVVKGKGNYSGTVTKYFNIVPKKQTVTGIRSPKAKQFKVAWKKDTQASGYEIYYSSRSDFKTHKTVTVSKKYTSKTVTGVTSGKKYYVKVRSYKLIGGKRVYGKYSAAKSVKIK